MFSGVLPDKENRMRSARRLMSVALLAVACAAATAPAAGPVKLGEDVLAEQNFAPLRGKRVGVITNHTGRNANGDHIIEVLLKNDVQVTKLFSPEHGLYGTKDEKVGDGIDQKTGLPVLSLYGKTRRPTQEMLANLDVLVFDIQDVGCRFYTYISTLGLCMEEAAKNNVAFVVLDRPNPISGTRVEGPIADDKHLGFTAYTNIPLVHGMTVGELAEYYNGEKKIGAKLTVIPMQGWTRDMYWEQTGVTWRNPSPNLRSPNQAVLYPAIGLLEASNIAVGRGTDAPFEQFGAPYVDGPKLAEALTNLGLPGVTFAPTSWTPEDKFHKFNKEKVNGVRVTVTDRNAFDSTATGMAFAWTLNRLYPGQWKKDELVKMAQNDAAVTKLFSLSDPKQANMIWQSELDAWKAVRAKYLKY